MSGPFHVVHVAAEQDRQHMISYVHTEGIMSTKESRLQGSTVLYFYF
jgi:hypothetical protein